MAPLFRDGWTTAALLAMGACTPVPPPDGPRSSDAGVVTSGPSDRDGQPLRGNVIVGKDGYGFTACGSTRQQRAEFSPAAQAVVDDHLDRGGAMEFAIDGHGATRDGRLVVATLSIVPATGACDAAPDADAPDA